MFHEADGRSMRCVSTFWLLLASSAVGSMGKYDNGGRLLVAKSQYLKG